MGFSSWAKRCKCGKLLRGYNKSGRCASCNSREWSRNNRGSAKLKNKKIKKESEI